MEQLIKQSASMTEAMKRFDGVKIRMFIQEPSGKAQLLAKISAAFSFQHTLNGARSSEKYTDQDIAMLQTNVYEIITESYLNLTVEEVFYSFKKGMSGGYGDDIYFSARNTRLWLNAYIDQERVKLAKQSAKNLEAMNRPPEITEAEKNQARKAMFKVFCDFLDKQYLSSTDRLKEGAFCTSDVNMCIGPTYWYDKFIEFGLMDEPSTEDKNKIYAESMNKAESIVISSNGILRPSLSTHQSGKVHDNAVILSKWYFVQETIGEWFKKGVDYKGLLMGSIE